jgi:hypothetical protein
VDRPPERVLAPAMLCTTIMSTLVVFYSRTGTTRHVAETIAGGLGADIEEVREAAARGGVVGYVRSVFDAALSRWVQIEALGRDPSRYDLVVVGSPVWGASVSAPIRAFLANNARRLPNVAFFLTEGGGGDRRVFRQMAEVACAYPRATLALVQRDVAQGKASEPIESFVASLRAKAAPASRFAEGVS